MVHLTSAMNNRIEVRDDATTAKDAWEAPTIEEIDYAQTEAAYINPGALDLGIYSV
jgi:hypothetical protein